MITPGLRDHLDMLAARAARQYANVWDVLDSAQLLFTEDVRRLQRSHALRSTLDELEARTFPQLLGPAYTAGRSTARDMRVSIQEFLAERVEMARRGQA